MSTKSYLFKCTSNLLYLKKSFLSACSINYRRISISLHMTINFFLLDLLDFSLNTLHLFHWVLTHTVKNLPAIHLEKPQREREQERASESEREQARKSERARELENNHTSSHWELHKLTSSIPSKGSCAAWQYCPALLTSSLIILNINFKPSPLYLELPFHNVSPNFTLGLTFYIFDK